MNSLTLSLPPAMEDCFWQLYKKSLVTCDAFCAVMSMSVIVIVDLDVFKFFLWNLHAHHLIYLRNVALRSKTFRNLCALHKSLIVSSSASGTLY